MQKATKLDKETLEDLGLSEGAENLEGEEGSEKSESGAQDKPDSAETPGEGAAK